MAGQPKTQRENYPPKLCCLCQKSINPGEKYHNITSRRGRKFVHDICYEEELRHDTTGARD